MKPRVSTLLFAGLLAGCANVTPVPPASSTSTHIVERNFTVGSTKKSFVGEAMIRIKDYYQTATRRNAWSISEPVKVEHRIGYEVVVPGTYPIAGQRTMDGVTYDVVNVIVHPIELLTLKPAATTAPVILLIDNSGRIARVMAPMGNTSEISTVPSDYRAKRASDVKIDTQKGYTNFELIYTGISGGVLRITYREYSPEDLARTAFFQDLTYNADQKHIRFRDLAIDVLSATNEAIEFRVTGAPEEYHTSIQGKNVQ